MYWTPKEINLILQQVLLCLDTFRRQTDLLQLERNKDAEISTLRSQMDQFKQSIETLGKDLNIARHKHEAEMLQKVQQFKAGTSLWSS